MCSVLNTAIQNAASGLVWLLTITDLSPSAPTVKRNGPRAGSRRHETSGEAVDRRTHIQSPGQQGNCPGLGSGLEEKSEAECWPCSKVRANGQRHFRLHLSGLVQVLRTSDDGLSSAYFVERIENALAAFTCQAEPQSPVRPLNRRRVDKKALGGVPYEVASPPPRV